METRCMGCMQIKRSGLRCEHCGFDERTANNTHQLPVGTVVGSQYTLGRVLGQGGFGITYIGWDNVMQQRVAVKEYFPSGYAGRSGNSQTVTSYDHQSRHDFENNKRRFLREAESLAKLWNVPQIVKVLRHFEENGTAYIAMEYVEGMDLRKYVKQHRGSLSVEETLSLLGPVIQALGHVHKAELVHRDISPDNIMVLPDGSTKLLDFGAARYVQNANALQDRDTSTQAILKHGFAPPEQYRTHGALGPWTDVYAMCATIYYCLTGKVLPEAMSRTMDDEQIDWSGLQALTRRQRAALEKGLEIQPKDRFATMEALWQQLKPQEPKPAPKKSKKPLLITAAAVAAVAAAVGIGLLQNGGEELPEETHLVRVPETSAVTTEEPTLPVETGAIDIPGDLMPAAQSDVKFTYEENETGITITGYEGELPEYVILPEVIDGHVVTEIGVFAFKESELISIVIPRYVTTIGHDAFAYCKKMEEIVIPDGVMSIGNCAFLFCDKLSSVTLPNGLLTIGASTFNGCGSLKNVTIPDSVTRIEESAFKHTNLNDVLIPESVTYIDESAFSQTPWLRAYTDDFLICGDGVLLQCNVNSEHLEIPDTVKMIAMPQYIINSHIKSISIPKSVTDIDEWSFTAFPNLSSVEFMPGIKIITRFAFADCGNISSITIPESVRFIEEGAFKNCDQLRSVTIHPDCEVAENSFPDNCTISYYEVDPDDSEEW